MNYKKSMVILCLIFSITLFSHSYANRNQCSLTQQNERDSLVEVYAASTIPGILVGAIGGALCKTIDNKFPDLFPVWWLLEMYERNSLIELMSNDMKNRDIEHHRAVLHLTAWIASWVSYLHS